MGDQVKESTTATKRAEYEAPAITDFGQIEEMTQGNLKVNIQDFPLGNVHVLPVLSEVVPQRRR